MNPTHAILTGRWSLQQCSSTRSPRPLGNVEALDWEGAYRCRACGPSAALTRIHYTGYDRHGNVVERDAEGFHARVVQHECDHLSGILYPMRMISRFGFTEVLFPEMDPDLDD